LITDRPLDVALWAGVAGASDVRAEGTAIRFRTSNATGSVAAVTALLGAHDVELVELHVKKASLEEVFLGLTAAQPKPSEEPR
jgi:hypothetical protein